MLVISLEPPFHFAVALWVLNSAKYLLNSVGIKKLSEFRVSIYKIRSKLAAVIAYALLNLSMFNAICIPLMLASTVGLSHSIKASSFLLASSMTANTHIPFPK